jgi:hypothetical protein
MRSAEITAYKPGIDLARFQEARLSVIVIPPSDSAHLDVVVARTRGDEAILEAVSVFIDHAGAVQWRYYLSRQKTFWPQLTTAPAHTGAVQTKNVKLLKGGPHDTRQC